MLICVHLWWALLLQKAKLMAVSSSLTLFWPLSELGMLEIASLRTWFRYDHAGIDATVPGTRGKESCSSYYIAKQIPTSRLQYHNYLLY